MYAPDSYRTSVLLATLSTYFSLISSFCSSSLMFAAGFFQIPPRDGHPCLSGCTIPTIRARWGLTPVRQYSCRAYQSPSPLLAVASKRRGMLIGTGAINYSPPSATQICFSLSFLIAMCFCSCFPSGCDKV